MSREPASMGQWQDYAELFAHATGHQDGPYRYQRALAESRELPGVLRIPTGSRLALPRGGVGCYDTSA